MSNRRAFTIIEVLIAIALMGIVLPALYEGVALLRDSNAHLFSYLQKAKEVSKVSQTLYLDILSSDGNISIQKDDFSQLCIEKSRNSLYALSVAKVCWVVLKKEKQLVRIEGYGYHLPLRQEERVEVDPVLDNIDLFDLYYKKDKLLLLLRQKNQEAVTFLIQGVSKPLIKKRKRKKVKKPNKNRKNPGIDRNNTTPPVPKIT